MTQKAILNKNDIKDVNPLYLKISLHFLKAVIRALILGPIAALTFCLYCFLVDTQNNFEVLRYYTISVFIIGEISWMVLYWIQHKNDFQFNFNQLVKWLILFTLFAYIPLNAVFVIYVFNVLNDPLLFGPLQIFDLSVTNTLIFIMFTLWYLFTDFFESWKSSLARNKDLEKERLKYQLEALKNQINPHFLFNNLNTLSELVHSDPNKFQIFIERFADVYRYLLLEKDKDLVKIKTELDFLDSFLFLIEIRFADRIVIDIDSKNLTDFYVAPVILQLLIENALKHNEASKNNPLQLKIFRDTENLIVWNSCRLKRTSSYSSGIGLSNIQERYKLLSQKPIQIIETMADFTVKIPIIDKPEISWM